MSLKSSLYTYLSDVIHDRIYPNMAPENATKPYITFQIISSDERHGMNGAVGFTTRRIQFDIYADSSTEVETEFDELRDQLDSYIGYMDNLEILSCFLEDERDGYVNPNDSSQIAKHRRIVDYMITHRTNIPGESG